MLLHEVGIVAEDGDDWRSGLHLRRIIQLHLASSCLRRLSPADDLPQGRIHLRRADPLVALGVDLEDQLENSRHSLSTYRRCENERHELEKWRLLVRLLLELRRRVVLLLLEVPLVNDDDQAAPVLPRQRSDLEILIVQALHRIENENADI